MANDLQISNAAINAALDALTALLNNGFIKLYTGAKPATADTALSGNTLLATLGFAAQAFGAAVAGVAAAGAISSDSTIDNTGTVTWARLLKSDGVTVVCDMTVGLSGCDINVNAVAFVAGAQASMSSLTITMPKGA